MVAHISYIVFATRIVFHYTKQHSHHCQENTMNTSSSKSNPSINRKSNSSKTVQKMHDFCMDGYRPLTRKELISLKKKLQTDIAKYPQESLLISKSNGVWQYYYYCGTHPGRKIYIPHKSIEYAKQLWTFVF